MNEPDGQSEPDSETTVARQERLLIVDDTLANLKLLTRMLREQGYQVRGADGGAIALEAARSFQPDLILLDVNMPEMDGLEVCRRLKAADEGDPRHLSQCAGCGRGQAQGV